MEKITMSREELEGKAKELGITFKATITDENLQKKIDAALNNTGNEGREELEGKIVITSICADFKKEATSYEEANEITGVSIDDIKSHAANGTMISGYRFKIVK